MKPIEPAELSAYLDGELNSARAREVQIALADEPRLRADFNTLAEADIIWRAAAESANLRPGVQLLPQRRTAHAVSVLGMIGLVTLLVAVRLLPKMTDTLTWGVVLHGLTLAMVLIWVLHMDRDGTVTASAHGARPR
jgi:anti-sigma factor RsiW